MQREKETTTKIYRIFSVIISVAVVIVIAFLYYLPEIKRIADERASDYRQRSEARDERLLAIEAMDGLDFLAFMTAQEREKNGIIRFEDYSREVLGRQDAEDYEEDVTDTFSGIRMELPHDTDFSDISLDEDFINHYVTLKISHANNEYLLDYPMIGSSDKIKNLSFANRYDGFVMQFEFDEAMKCTLTLDEENERYVYIDFVSPSDMYDHIVVIDAGHGERMAGAVVGGYMEKDINLAVVTYIKELFDQEDTDTGVFYTRLDDSDVPLSDRSGLANELDADLFISIHCNSYSKQESVRGTQVLCDMTENPVSEASKELSGMLLKNVTAALDTKDMGVIDGEDKYILRTSEVPSALLEIGFMTNDTDLSKLTDGEYQKKCARAVYDTVMTYIGEKE